MSIWGKMMKICCVEIQLERLVRSINVPNSTLKNWTIKIQIKNFEVPKAAMILGTSPNSNKYKYASLICMSLKKEIIIKYRNI